MFHVCRAFLSVHCSLVVTCWERADLLALLYVMFYFVFVTFPYGILGKVWYLIVLIPDLCLLTYFDQNFMKLDHIVEHHNVFKFDDGPYPTMHSGIIALCSWKFTIFDGFGSIIPVVLIRILWNLVTLFSTIMSLPSFEMAISHHAFRS